MVPSNNISEKSLFANGALVKTSCRIYSMGEAVDPSSLDEHTSGIILQGPNSSYPHHYQVQFVGNVIWWVAGNEIEPYEF